MCTIILRESASPNQKSCEGGCAGASSSRCVTRVVEMYPRCEVPPAPRFDPARAACAAGELPACARWRIINFTRRHEILYNDVATFYTVVWNIGRT
jgi:hypothetical protein